jgi:hypothetical protein
MQTFIRINSGFITIWMRISAEYQIFKNEKGLLHVFSNTFIQDTGLKPEVHKDILNH